MMTARARTGAAIAAAGLMLGMLSACTPDPEPTPTKTTLFASEEEAFAAAEETYREYMAVYTSLDVSDPRAYETTQPYVTGPYAAADREGLSRLYADNLTRTGESVVVSFRGVEFNAPDEVIARTCDDVSETDILDSSGKSVVSPERRDKYALDLTFTVKNGTLRIQEAQAVEDSTCI